MNDKQIGRSVDFQLTYSQKMQRFYFNRFMFSHSNGVMCVRVWFQDDLKRDGVQYSFVFSDEDFQTCKSNIKNYLQKVLRDSSVADSGKARLDQCPLQSTSFDNARVIMCSRSGTRAEIYLGYFPLAMTVSTMPDDVKWKNIPLDVVLCSDLECHLSLLKMMVEA